MNSADASARFDPKDAARAVDALRRGWPVSIDGAITLLAIETADDARLAAFGGAGDVLMSAARAATLKLANQIDAATPGKPVRIAAEHVALVIGDADGERAPLVRLHSECLTGDILGSLKCDCGPQLDAALRAMAAEAAKGGWGVLLYLRQEGRGIGLINKLRAYRLQDQGFDTVDANNRLGCRPRRAISRWRRGCWSLLGVRAIRLMTNNPAKVSSLEAEGVVDRNGCAPVAGQPAQCPLSRHQARPDGARSHAQRGAGGDACHILIARAQHHRGDLCLVTHFNEEEGDQRREERAEAVRLFLLRIQRVGHQRPRRHGDERDRDGEAEPAAVQDRRDLRPQQAPPAHGWPAWQTGCPPQSRPSP
jgi:GTP cyclohydrolase II